MADEDTFNAKEEMQKAVRTKTVPPPTRNPSRLQALSMLAAVVAATISNNRGLRNAVGIVIARKGEAGPLPIWKALSPKNTEVGKYSGILHKTMLKPATSAGRALAQAAEGTKCYMFKRDQCPPMIDPNTVLMLTASGTLCVAYTISYVNGMVGCSKHYHKHNKGRKCKGWEGYVDFHHVATLLWLTGLCFVPNAINKLISQTVNPTPTKSIPRKNIEASYEPFEPYVILDNISQLKRHEDSILTGDVDCVEIQRGKSRDQPAKLLIASLMPGGPNFSLYLKKADSGHRRLAGVSKSMKGIYQFVDEERPDFIHPSCVLQVYVHTPPDYPSQPKKNMIRVLHCRCPILGIGGTKVGGGSSGEEAKNKTWPVVLHHLGKDDLSLVVFCHSEVNLALDFIP